MTVVASTVANKDTIRWSVQIPESFQVNAALVVRKVIQFVNVLKVSVPSARKKVSNWYNKISKLELTSALGHARKECTGQQLVNLSFVKVRDPESAWNDLVKASDEDDIDDFKIHMLEYLKSNPGISFADMERAFRGSNLRFYIFALSLDEVSYSKILIGPNGESGVKYVWCLNRSVKPRRSKALSGRLAETPEENLIRLEKAGFLEDYLGDYCRKCKSKL